MKYWLILFYRKARLLPNQTIFAIVVLCALTLLVQGTLGLQEEMTKIFGTIPVLVVDAWNQLGSGSLFGSGRLLTVVSALFMHGGAGHFANNMLFFWAFGSLAVQHLGRWNAVALFLFCGICGNIMQILLNPASTIPIIGASGSVSGLEGIYLGLAIFWRLPWPDVPPLARPIHPLQLCAFALLGAIIDLVSVMGPSQGVAFGAHLGGFVSGLVVARLVTWIYASREDFAVSGWRR